MSTFSSNIHRVAQAIEKHLIMEEKFVLLETSMEKNLEITMSLGYINSQKINLLKHMK